MNTLPQLTEQDGRTVVDARELHTFLESKRDFSHWIKFKIKKYGFVENQDYVTLAKKDGRQVLIEYGLTLDMAKELAMVENNENGRKVRNYFIECEKKASEPKQNLNISEREVLLLQKEVSIISRENALLQKEVRSMYDMFEETLNELRRNRYYTVNEFLNAVGRNGSVTLRQEIGQRATEYCKRAGLEKLYKTNDRFDYLGAYPECVLREIIFS